MSEAKKLGLVHSNQEVDSDLPPPSPSEKMELNSFKMAIQDLEKEKYIAEISLRRQKTKYENKIAKLERKKEELEEDLSQLATDLSHSQLQFEEAQKKTEEQLELSLQYKEETNKILREKVDFEENYKSAKELLVAKQNEVTDTEYHIENLSTALNTIEEQIADKKQDLNLINEHIKDSKEELDQLKTEKSEFLFKIENFEDKITSLKSEHDKVSLELQEKEETLSSISEDIIRSQKDHEFIICNQEETQQEVDALKKRHLELSVQVNQLNQQKEDLGTTISDLLEQNVEALRFAAF